MQALDRESQQIQKEQRQVEVIDLRTKELTKERFKNLIELEEQEDDIESQMEEKARLIKQKNELTNLMKTVENNIEPKRFKTMLGQTQGTGNQATLTDELLDFDSMVLPDPVRLLGRDN